MEEAIWTVLKEQLEKHGNWVCVFSEMLQKQQDLLERQSHSIDELRQQLNERSVNSLVMAVEPSGSSLILIMKKDGN